MGAQSRASRFLQVANSDLATAESSIRNLSELYLRTIMDGLLEPPHETIQPMPAQAALPQSQVQELITYQEQVERRQREVKELSRKYVELYGLDLSTREGMDLYERTSALYSRNQAMLERLRQIVKAMSALAH